jgi:hypothetical protein
MSGEDDVGEAAATVRRDLGLEEEREERGEKSKKVEKKNQVRNTLHCKQWCGSENLFGSESWSHVRSDSDPVLDLNRIWEKFGSGSESYLKLFKVS